MAVRGTVVRIKSLGASWGVAENKVWASLLDDRLPDPAEWVITPVGKSVQLADRASSSVLAVPSTEPDTQATLAARGAVNSRWTLTPRENDTPVTVVTESGWYYLELAGTGNYLGASCYFRG